ncbi:unnamed protein product [Moneuplotes crassus]|uniref:Uncharacterized protein n=1 Tax=Euplotes crassus TaxID=5936 RepID=A0AAD2DCJ3_EUPCR|nr:unnamed protein product [Moneuplotes crassus]
MDSDEFPAGLLKDYFVIESESSGAFKRFDLERLVKEGRVEGESEAEQKGLGDESEKVESIGFAKYSDGSSEAQTSALVNLYKNLNTRIRKSPSQDTNNLKHLKDHKMLLKHPNKPKSTSRTPRTQPKNSQNYKPKPNTNPYKNTLTQTPNPSNNPKPALNPPQKTPKPPSKPHQNPRPATQIPKTFNPNKDLKPAKRVKPISEKKEIQGDSRRFYSEKTDEGEAEDGCERRCSKGRQQEGNRERKYRKGCVRRNLIGRVYEMKKAAQIEHNQISLGRRVRDKEKDNVKEKYQGGCCKGSIIKIKQIESLERYLSSKRDFTPNVFPQMPKIGTLNFMRKFRNSHFSPQLKFNELSNDTTLEINKLMTCIPTKPKEAPIAQRKPLAKKSTKNAENHNTSLNLKRMYKRLKNKVDVKWVKSNQHWKELDAPRIRLFSQEGERSKYNINMVRKVYRNLKLSNSTTNHSLISDKQIMRQRKKRGFASVKPRLDFGTQDPSHILSVNDTMYTDRTGRNLSEQYRYCNTKDNSFGRDPTRSNNDLTIAPYSTMNFGMISDSFFDDGHPKIHKKL